MQLRRFIASLTMTGIKKHTDARTKGRHLNQKTLNSEAENSQKRNQNYPSKFVGKESIMLKTSEGFYDSI